MDDRETADLKKRVRRGERAIVVLSALLAIVASVGAAGPLGDLYCRSLVVKDDSGRKTVEIRSDGDVDVAGRLRVGKVDILDRVSEHELKVAEVEFTLTPIPLHPNHGFWGMKRSGAATPVIVDMAKVPAGTTWDVFFAQAAATSDPFGTEIVASWITPTVGLHEVFGPDCLLGRLESKVVSKNRIAIVGSCVGKRQATACAFKLVVIYR